MFKWLKKSKQPLVVEAPRVLEPEPLVVPAVTEPDPHRNEVVILPDGRPGVIDHVKADGKLGVRPVHPHTGDFLPNPSSHWTPEQRAMIPEEIAVHATELRRADFSQVPAMIRNGEKKVPHIKTRLFE